MVKKKAATAKAPSARRTAITIPAIAPPERPEWLCETTCAVGELVSLAPCGETKPAVGDADGVKIGTTGVLKDVLAVVVGVAVGGLTTPTDRVVVPPV